MTNRNIGAKPLALQPEWQYHGVLSSKMKNFCSICLEESPSLQLACSHAYHRKCIVACMRRKQECALCRSTDFNTIKIYCEQCLGAYFATTFLENMQQIEGEQKFCCNECKEGSIYSIQK
jgi:hypothetical protein